MNFILKKSVANEPKTLLQPCSKRNISSTIVNISIASRRLDVIIFGATGCAGRFTVFEATRVLKYYKWGVAGRNKKKLQSLLQEVGMQTRKNLSKVPVIVANAQESGSLNRLAHRCRVIVNCCGPYECLGEKIIKACISAKTHYVDLCMESYFMDYILYKYEEKAREKHVYVVMACGLQSLPADVGVNYMKRNFNGTINNIETFTEFWSQDPFTFGSIGNKNIWASLVLGNSNMKKFNRRLLPRIEPVVSRRVFYESEIAQGFCVPAPTVDEDVVDRSQYFFYEEKNKRPIQFHNYFSFPHPLLALTLLVWYFIISMLSQLAFTRRLLLNWPRIFSLGFFSPTGPREENADSTYFSITFKAEGWDKSTYSPKHVREPVHVRPNKCLLGRVSGSCPMYGVACVCLLVSGLTILTETGKLPKKGGVFTPGAAFANTKIISALEKHEHGLTFELLE